MERSHSRRLCADYPDELLGEINNSADAFVVVWPEKGVSAPGGPRQRR